MKLLLLSDIHGNLSSLNAVLGYIKRIQVDSVALLGDLIDYCPHSNEAVKIISELDIPVACNIWGNHEEAIMNGNFQRFSSPRGAESAKYTKSVLNVETQKYLESNMEKNGTADFSIDGKRFLAVHATIEDKYWGKFDVSKNLSAYSEYDVVLMGHSHRPIFYEAFFPCENSLTRNQRKTIFINPGSVGQPRNLNPNAQFAIFDTETEMCEFLKIPYNITDEQKSFSDKVDAFYKIRLEVGI